MSSQKTVLSYCALSMGFTMLSRGFSFYYVKVFLDHYNISESWFHISQMLYMVWNAVNDPLFAILQDNTEFLLTRTRREGILYTAPFFALSFLVPWFKFGESSWAIGLHLIIALFLWDTMFTFIGLLSCCLFTEFSSDPQTRLKLTRYSTAASLIGAQSVFFLEFASSSLKNFQAFQMVAVCIACVSCMLMVYTGCNAQTRYDVPKSESDENLADPVSTGFNFFRKMKQLFMERNFISFVITNFFQGFHKAFLGGFLVIMCDFLVPSDQVSPGVRSVFYTLTGTAGGIAVILGAPFVGRFGYFHVIRYSFMWKIVSGITMYVLIGYSNAWLVMLFLLLDITFAAATFSLFNMPLSDIADEDKKKYQRKKPISSTVFGTNALVTKPALSLSPMLVVAILNHFGYEHIKKGLGSETETDHMKTVMFHLICFFPIVIGVIQYIVWSLFTNRSRIIEKNVSIEEVL